MIKFKLPFFQGHEDNFDEVPRNQLKYYPKNVRTFNLLFRKLSRVLSHFCRKRFDKKLRKFYKDTLKNFSTKNPKF